MIIVTGGGGDHYAEYEEAYRLEQRKKWRRISCCGVLFWLTIWFTLVVFTMPGNSERANGAEPQSCEVVSCEGCGNAPETCSRDQDLMNALGTCRRRAQRYTMIVKGTSKQQECSEDGRGDREVNLEDGVPGVGEDVPCFQSRDDLMCRKPVDFWPLAMINGFPAGLAALGAALCCLTLLVLSFTAKRPMPMPHGGGVNQMTMNVGGMYNPAHGPYSAGNPAVIGQQVNGQEVVMGNPVSDPGGAPPMAAPTRPPEPQPTTVRIPPGYNPGDTIQVQTPTGPVMVMPPPGLQPGQEFMVMI